MATIVPESGDFMDTLRLALELSDRPRDVRIVSVQAIEMPDATAERLDKYRDLGDEEPEQPKKRGPGRPRKNPLPEQE